MGHSAEVWNDKASLEVTEDLNGIKHVLLRSPRGASARVCLFGGQVVSWTNERGEELLFTSSSKATNNELPKTIRGGISICFPQVGNSGLLEQQGLARNKHWKIEENPPPLPPKDSIGEFFVDLLLRPVDIKCWPNCFEFRLRVSLALDGNLILISRVRNINGKPFSFSFAYHTYLSVSDISEVRIEGLETLEYLDNLYGRERFTEQGDAITFESEVDRVYLDSLKCVAVLDHERKRTFVMRKDGLPDVVVWNPWEKKCKAMADIGDDEYKYMVCVDGAAIERKISLRQGEEWTGRIELVAVPSSFCTDRLHPRLNFF